MSLFNGPNNKKSIVDLAKIEKLNKILSENEEIFDSIINFIENNINAKTSDENIKKKLDFIIEIFDIFSSPKVFYKDEKRKKAFPRFIKNLIKFIERDDVYEKIIKNFKIDLFKENINIIQSLDYKNFERFINLAFSGKIDYEKIKDYKMPNNFTHQEQVNFLNIFLEDKEKIHINENGTEIFPLSHKSAYIDLFKKELKISFNLDKNQTFEIEKYIIRDPDFKINAEQNRKYLESEKGREEFCNDINGIEGMNPDKYKGVGRTDNDKNNKQNSARSGINQQNSVESGYIKNNQNNNKTGNPTKKHLNKKFLYSILSVCIVNIFIFVYSKEILNKIGNLTQSNSFIDFTKNNQILSIFFFCAIVILAELMIGISCKKGFELIGSQENNAKTLKNIFKFE